MAWSALVDPADREGARPPAAPRGARAQM